jgi:hypothetical protein
MPDSIETNPPAVDKDAPDSHNLGEYIAKKIAQWPCVVVGGEPPVSTNK